MARQWPSDPGLTCAGFKFTISKFTIS